MLTGRGLVLDAAEARKALLVDVGLERAERGDEHVHAQVKLFAANEQRVVQVPRAHVAAGCALAWVRPFLHLVEPVHQEDAPALR